LPCVHRRAYEVIRETTFFDLLADELARAESSPRERGSRSRSRRNNELSIAIFKHTARAHSRSRFNLPRPFGASNYHVASRRSSRDSIFAEFPTATRPPKAARENSKTQKTKSSDRCTILGGNSEVNRRTEEKRSEIDAKIITHSDTVACPRNPGELDRRLRTIDRNDYTTDFALQVDPIYSARCDAIYNTITRSRGRVPRDAETRALLSGRQLATNCGSSATTS
jgi:hypothetical protein